MAEITLFTKAGGILTKRISLAVDGSVKSDGSACKMSQGDARRVDVAGVKQLVDVIGQVQSNQAIALGVLKPDLPAVVRVATKKKLVSEVVRPDVIARTGDAIIYRDAHPAFALLDFDTKGMPPHVGTELKRLGGFWGALLSVLRVFGDVAHLVRRSTSSGLSRSDSGDELPGSDGLHVYVEVQNGADIERFLRELHARCWLAGLGWMMVGAAGQFLERSIVDRMVGSPERLVFEGSPILVPPLQQDLASRRPVAFDGGKLDTIAACPSLSIVEKAKFDSLRAKETQRLVHEAMRVRATYVEQKAKDITERTGMLMLTAKRIIERQLRGILLPDIVLPFDDEEFAGCTVAEVLADPDRFEGVTLADPNEGADYGHCVAKILRGPDGAPWIHSFAHGCTIYKLKYDLAAVQLAIEKADKAVVVKTLIDLVVVADLNEHELEQLRDLASKRSGAGKQAIKTMLKAAQKEHTAERAEHARNRRAAGRSDPRPQIFRPTVDAPWLPQMQILNEVLGSSPAKIPPARNIDDDVTRARKLRVPNTHAFTNGKCRSRRMRETRMTKLPTPEQWVLSKMNEMEVAEMIERYIDYVDEEGSSVNLPMPFVRHYMRRDDNALPIVVAIATLPIVLADGGLLASDGLDRGRGIIFEIQKEVRAIIPDPAKCTKEAVRRAMQFLCDDWLCDVATDYTGKCTVIVAALTIIERSLLDERPAFFVTAGRRGGGKTTLLYMLIMAVTGIKPAASAWSNNEEERRKALLSYFLYGVPYILWDNIARGSQISCPHIERSCTAKFYIDRKLGVSEVVATAASTIHLFTGNNISARGDLSSRSLHIRLNVDRPDPENREFKHPDPTGWTEGNRAEILLAFYTILLATRS